MIHYQYASGTLQDLATQFSQHNLISIYNTSSSHCHNNRQRVASYPGSSRLDRQRTQKRVGLISATAVKIKTLWFRIVYFHRPNKLGTKCKLYNAAESHRPFETMANLAAAAFSCGLLLIAATSSMAFPSGAPVTACSTLTPLHTTPTPCGPNCPFSLTLTAVDGSAPQTPMRYRCGSLHTSKMNSDWQVEMLVLIVQASIYPSLNSRISHGF